MSWVCFILDGTGAASQGAIASCDEGSSQGAIDDLFCEGHEVGDNESLVSRSPRRLRWLAGLLLCLGSVGDTSGDEEGRNIEVEN